MIPATQSPTTPARAARPLAVLLALLLANPAPAQQNTTTHYGYDPQGNLTTVTDPRSLVAYSTANWTVIPRQTGQ